MITRVSYHFNQHIYTNCTQLYINKQLVWMVKGHLAHSLIAYSIGAYLLQILKHNEVKWRHALMIRVIYTWLSWLALGHKHNWIMAALGHSHNHSGMQDYSCSVIKCTTARCHKIPNRQGCVDVCNLCANGISIQTSSMCIPVTHWIGIHTPLHTASRLVQAGSLKLGPNAIHQTHTRHAYCRPVRGVRVSAIHSYTHKQRV